MLTNAFLIAVISAYLYIVAKIVILEKREKKMERFQGNNLRPRR